MLLQSHVYQRKMDFYHSNRHYVLYSHCDFACSKRKLILFPGERKGRNSAQEWLGNQCLQCYSIWWRFIIISFEKYFLFKNNQYHMSFRWLKQWIFPDSSCLCSGNELRYLCQYSLMQNQEKQRILQRNIRIPTMPLEASNGEFLDQRKFLKIRCDFKFVSMISGKYTHFIYLTMRKFFNLIMKYFVKHIVFFRL